MATRGRPSRDAHPRARASNANVAANGRRKLSSQVASRPRMEYPAGDPQMARIVNEGPAPFSFSSPHISPAILRDFGVIGPHPDYI